MNDKMLIPVSILIAGLLIGTGVYFATSAKPVTPTTQENKKTQSPIKVNPATDHIVGNKNADMYIIEYSDLECPFCKRYNDNASEKLIEKYAKEEKIAFVFRHMPLSSIHPSAFGEAVATECAAKLGGEEKFFAFKKEIFALTKSDGNFDTTQLTQIAQSLGIDSAAFNSCTSDKTISEKVEASFEEAILAGIQGTPTVFVQLKDGETFPIAASFEKIDTIISAFLNEQ